jgi:hypothetical protein
VFGFYVESIEFGTSNAKSLYMMKASTTSAPSLWAKMLLFKHSLIIDGIPRQASPALTQVSAAAAAPMAALLFRTLFVQQQGRNFSTSDTIQQ